MLFRSSSIDEVTLFEASRLEISGGDVNEDADDAATTTETGAAGDVDGDGDGDDGAAGVFDDDGRVEGDENLSGSSFRAAVCMAAAPDVTGGAGVVFTTGWTP